MAGVRPEEERPIDPTTPALVCRGLVKRFGAVTAVSGLDLEVRRGECFGLLGPNGAGKTTTVEILEGLTVPDAGEVEILGMRWGRGEDHALRQRLGIQLQETVLADKLKVGEVVRLFRSFYPQGLDPAEVIARLELEPKVDAGYYTLSGGQKQRVALACALVGQPEVLFLDEPTTGLDPQARRRIWEVVDQFRDAGGTVLLTTHYMEEAATLCDRVAVIDKGRVLALDTPTALIASLGVAQIVELVCAPLPAPEELAGLPGVQACGRRLDRLVLEVAEIEPALRGLLALVADRGWELGSLATHQPTLEDVFLHLTGTSLRES